MDNKNYFVSEYFGLLFLPYVSLTYTKEEIQEIIDYGKKIKKINEENIINSGINNLLDFKNWNVHDLYSCFYPDYEIVKIYKFIIAFYDENLKDINRKKIEENFTILKNYFFSYIRKNISDINDFKKFRKNIKWIFKLLTIEEKNKIFELFKYPKNKFYEPEDATNILINELINHCKNIYKYKENNIWKVKVIDNLCDHDRYIIEPIIEYVKKNFECVDLEEFKIKKQLDFKKENLQKQNEKEIVKIKKYLDNDKTLKLNDSLKHYIFLNIKQINFMVAWLCYIQSTIYFIYNVEEIKQFLITKSFIDYIIKVTSDIEKIKSSLIFGLYLWEISIIVEKLKSTYPKKYNFLGFQQIIIQPYIIFMDIINIISKEINDKFFIKLFKLKDLKNNKNIFYFINKQEEFNQKSFIKNIQENIKKSSNYLVIALNNNINSLNQISNYKEKGLCSFPVYMKLNNKNYIVHSIIIYKDHHYEHVLVYPNENSQEIKEEEINHLNIRGWIIHMLMYKIQE